MKQENCCAFQILVVHQSQLFNQGIIRLFECSRFQTTGTGCKLPEAVQSQRIQMANPNIWHRHSIPALARLSQQESIKSGSLENLLCSTTPVVVLPSIANGHRVWFYCNTQV